MSDTEKGKYTHALDLFSFLMECHPSYVQGGYIQLPVQFARELNIEISNLKFMFIQNTKRLEEKIESEKK